MNMQPQQPQQPQQPANYDFIMNPEQTPKRSPFSGNNSMAMRLLVVAGALFILMIVAFIVMRLMGAGGADFDKKAMLSVAQDQTEIVRLADRGLEEASAQSTKNLSITVKLGVQSEQNKLLEYLASAGYTPKPKDLALKHNAQTDTQLDQAKSSSTFDTAFTGVIKQSLETYKADLTAAYNSAKDAQAKSQLQERYKVADTLLAQFSD